VIGKKAFNKQLLNDGILDEEKLDRAVSEANKTGIVHWPVPANCPMSSPRN